jgi:hypothetical protein
LFKLDVNPTVSSISADTVAISPSFNATIINNRTVTTTVTVQDGHTIVIGGIIDSQRSSTEKKVPIVGDIPWLGRLFKDRTDTKNRTELLIVLTPRILRNQRLSDYITDKEITESTEGGGASRAVDMQSRMNTNPEPGARPFALPVDQDFGQNGPPIGPGGKLGIRVTTDRTETAPTPPPAGLPKQVIIPSDNSNATTPKNPPATQPAQ